MRKFIRKTAVLIWLSGLFFTAQVLAQLDGDPENICRNGYFPRASNNYEEASVKGKKGEKIYFYSDEREDCPAGRDCRLKSYLIPGDKVIVSRELGNFACVWFQPRKGSETVGWIRLDKLDLPYGQRIIRADDWVGRWTFYDNSIEITKTSAPNVYKIKGNALWKGLGDNVHVGELDGEARFTERSLKYGEDSRDEYDCRVTMRLAGNFMIVSDNLQCGGANVTFSGVYQKKTKN